LQATWSEVRFFGRTSSHQRTLHFKTQDASALNYITKGTGALDPAALRTSFTMLEDHTATLPVAATAGASSTAAGVTAATVATQLLLSGSGSQSTVYYCAGCTSGWRVDDSTGTLATIHQIWVRVAPSQPAPAVDGACAAAAARGCQARALSPSAAAIA